MKADPPYRLIETLKANFMITPGVILILPCVSMSPESVNAKIAPTIAARIFKSQGRLLSEIGSFINLNSIALSFFKAIKKHPFGCHVLVKIKLLKSPVSLSPSSSTMLASRHHAPQPECNKSWLNPDFQLCRHSRYQSNSRPAFPDQSWHFC